MILWEVVEITIVGAIADFCQASTDMFGKPLFVTDLCHQRRGRNDNRLAAEDPELVDLAFEILAFL